MDLTFVVQRGIEGSEMWANRHVVVRGALNPDDIPDVVRFNCRAHDPRRDGPFSDPWAFDVAAQREEQAVADAIFHPPPKPDLRRGDITKLLGGLSDVQLNACMNTLGFPKSRWTYMSTEFGEHIGEAFEVWDQHHDIERWLAAREIVFPTLLKRR